MLDYLHYTLQPVLDSYRADGAYSGFQYEGFEDYYSEADYGYALPDDYNSRGSEMSGGRKEKKNIWGCLFPWIGQQQQEQEKQQLEDDNKAVIEHQASDSSSSVSLTPSIQEAASAAVSTAATLDEEEAKQEAINAAASAAISAITTGGTPDLSPPRIKAKSLGTGAIPTPPPSDMKSEQRRESGTSVTFQASPPPSTPHMMLASTDTLNSSSTAASELPEENVLSDEKKQEDGDVVAPAAADAKEDEQQQDEEKNEGDESPPQVVKGILKVRRCSIRSLNSVSSSLTKPKVETKKKDGHPPAKRHLFPTYEPKTTSHSNDPNATSKSVNWVPMARVLTIPSRKDIPLHQKAQVWWQRCDYDEFKKTGRIISKAMECGGSEIWLASSNAWGNRSAKQAAQQKKQINSPSSPKSVTQSDEKRSNSDMTITSSTSEEDEYNKALSKYVPKEKELDESDKDNETGNKWWCKFGHSRRGLEHIASSSEGRARQQSVLLAIRMVMEEQKRQRASRTKDPNKLRNVAYQYTSWARDLALAGGSADAEAVSSGFDPKAASRAHHFAKRLNNGSTTSKSLHPSNDNDNLVKVGHTHKVAAAVTSQILDANTHARPGTQPKKKAQSKSLGDIAADPDTSLSKRAKGYMPGEGNVSAATIIAGMGNTSPVVVMPQRSVKV